MPHRCCTTVLGAATLVAAFWLSGCTREVAAPTPTATTAVSASQNTSPLPEPVALTDLLGRLADPAVPGTDKLPLVQDATASDAGALDNFTRALQDNHMVPLTFTAADMAWSDQSPGNVVANITATGPDPNIGGLSFPMEFIPVGGGWQLSRRTVDTLLVFGDSANQPLPPDLTSPAEPVPGPPPPAPAIPG